MNVATNEKDWQVIFFCFVIYFCVHQIILIIFLQSLVHYSHGINMAGS